MNKRWKTWSPFQSRDVREICAHLTDDEIDMFVERAKDFGAMIGARITSPIAIMTALAFVIIAFVIIAFYGGLIVFFLIPCAWILVNSTFLQRHLKKNKELLCSTAWAKEQGFEPDRLKLFSFPGWPE